MIQSTPLSPLVVKIGGSLFDTIGTIVPEILHSDRRILVVPGGGKFADAVRDLSVHENVAHWMAIAGMEQFGWYIHSFGIPVRETLGISERPEVLLPYRVLRQADPLPHTWDVTSDTISAWVAYVLQAELLLLKSVGGIIAGNEISHHITAPVSTDTVDPCLIPFVLRHAIRTTVLDGRRPDSLAAFLQGNDAGGTVIDATL